MAGAPKAMTDKLQRLLNAAARLVSDTGIRSLSEAAYACRHSLARCTGTSEVQARVELSMVHNCLHHKAPRYLMDCCIPVSDLASRQHFRRHYLVVPRHSLSSYVASGIPCCPLELSHSMHDLLTYNDVIEVNKPRRQFGIIPHTCTDTAAFHYRPIQYYYYCHVYLSTVIRYKQSKSLCPALPALGCLLFAE